MNLTPKSIVLSLAAAASLLVACSSAPEDAATTSSDDEALELGTTAHFLKKHTSDAVLPDGVTEADVDPETAAAAKAHLKYYGGPVIANVKVYAVYWGKGVKNEAHINSFYPAITKSAYFTWLTEYNTAKEKIGHGSFGGAHTITPSITAKSIDDSQIQKELAHQMSIGKLPKQDGVNNLYMVYFPPGYSITMSGSTSCVQFCAYHGTFKRGGQDVFYGVMPDLTSGGCEQGCGGGAAQDNITEVSSHEMIEATTDAAVGLATTYGPPLAWYDQVNGEIGDICVGKAGKVAGYTIQLEWSNKRGKCVAQ